MKTLPLIGGVGILCSTLFYPNYARAAVSLPADAALPLASASEPGFVVRTAQASTNVVTVNSLKRAVQQLNGTLRDAGNNLVANIAVAGTNNGAYRTRVISFEKDSGYIDLKDSTGTVVWGFFSEFFPGIPGEEGETTQFATEVVGLVYLTAGTHTLGVSANADRTDVNDDDGYVLYVGQNPRDFFATKVGEFERAGAAAFSGNQPVENQIVVTVPATGVYPFRIVHWQQGRGANLQFFRVNNATTERILIGDDTASGYDPVFTKHTNARFNAPYIGEISPAPGSAGNNSAEPIQITLIDGSGATVNQGSIQLQLNGATVVPTIVKTGNKTSITFAANPNRPEANNIVSLSYSDSLGVANNRQWNFGIITAGGSSTFITGQWDFDMGDLRATVGKPLAFLDPTFDGPSGSAANKTAFGTCAALGIPLINGQESVVMKVPGDLDRRIGYVMDHGIAPNGGGTKVNQYTLIMDVYVETTGPGAASLLQISSTANTDDGDLFWQGSNFGQGGGGYNGKGTFTAGAWHRVIAAYDLAANPPVVTKYVDGVKQDDWTANQSLDAARRALQPTAILFGDGDQDERRTMYVNSIQIRAGKLTDAEMIALGAADAGGIPAQIPASTVTGQWDFEFGDLHPTAGAPLAYLDPTYDGPTGTGTTLTTFGTCTELGIATINGADAKVMKVPGELDRRIGYVMAHRIAPNGGGTRVNQYTLIMDVYVDTSGPGAASLWQVSSTANTDDGDLFWQGSNFGQGGDGYIGKGTFTAGAWHRVVAAYDMAAATPVVTKYVDGIKQHDWTANQGLDAPRRALQPTAILFGDGDQDERRVMYVNSVQIRAGKLSDAECALLGGPSAAGIPVVIGATDVTGQWDFNSGDLSATVGKDLAYLNPTVDGPNGTGPGKTEFGLATALGAALINNVDGAVVKVPGDLSRDYGYVMTHGIAPNGGGTKVNQYTLIMDIFVDTSGPGAASLLQVSSTANTDDGDLFWQGNNFGQGGDGYIGQGTFTAGAWHRVAAAYNMAANPPVVTKYVDGIFQHDWTANQGLDAPRRALQPTAVLFGDGDQDERRVMWVDSIQIRSGALSKEQLAALGAPSGNGIPLLIGGAPTPSIRVGKIGNQLVLNWSLSATGYKLQSTTNVSDPASWTDVTGVANNSVVIPMAPTGGRYYRLVQ